MGAMKKSIYTPEYATLRAALRAARETAAISQRDLATRLKVPHSWVAKVESGERRIDLVEFCWFLAACGVDPIPASEKLLQQIVGRQPASPPKGGRAK
jgi:transcriptional regulator with XRE-family HTH domain